MPDSTNSTFCALTCYLNDIHQPSAIPLEPASPEGLVQSRLDFVVHAAHETERAGATAFAAFHAFRPQLLAQLHKPQPRPMSEIVILGAQHETNLGERVAQYDQPRTLRIQILLEDYSDTYGSNERRLAAYELANNKQLIQRLGY